MLVFVCGLVGSGKTTLARGIAEHFQLPLCELDVYKREVYPLDPDFERNMREGIPFRNATRYKAYDRGIVELRRLLAQHRHVVAEEALHIQRYRTYFRDFGVAQHVPTVFLWTETTDAIAEQRLSAVREGHMLTNSAIAMRRNMQKECDGTEDVDAHIENSGSTAAALSQAIAFLTPLLS